MSHVRLFLEPGTWNLEPGIQRGRWAAVFLRLCFPGSLMSFPEGRAFAERKRSCVTVCWTGLQLFLVSEQKFLQKEVIAGTLREFSVMILTSKNLRQVP